MTARIFGRSVVWLISQTSRASPMRRRNEGNLVSRGGKSGFILTRKMKTDDADLKVLNALQSRLIPP